MSEKNILIGVAPGVISRLSNVADHQGKDRELLILLAVTAAMRTPLMQMQKNVRIESNKKCLRRFADLA